MAYRPLGGGRDELFGESSGTQRNPTAVGQWSTGDTDDDDDETTETRNMSIPQLRQQQYQVIDEQDKGLEALSEVITRQKRLATAIGTEVEYQNDLIEDITDHVDRTRDRLQGETSRVRTIDRKDRTCGYWIVIIVLFVVMVIIISL